MKTLPLLALLFFLTLPFATAQTSGTGQGGGYDGQASTAPSQPKPGANFMWQGELKTDCHVVAVDGESATISSSGGLFAVVWGSLPDEVRAQLQSEYDRLVKAAKKN